jgi:DNA-binding MarR family transcriptional regulator
MLYNDCGLTIKGLGLSWGMPQEKPLANSPPPTGRLDLSPLEDDVGFQIHLTRRAIWSALRQSRREPKPRLPSGYVACLLLIGVNPRISPSQIADALVLDMPNLALILRLMDKTGLIERQRNPADKRRLEIILTEAGKAQFDIARKASISHNGRICKDLSAAEARQLVDLLVKVRSSLVSAGL